MGAAVETFAESTTRALDVSTGTLDVSTEETDADWTETDKFETKSASKTAKHIFKM